MDRMFDSMYVQGYLAALQDVDETIKSIQLDLKHNKVRQNAKTYSEIVKCMIKNRAILREEPYSFVRYNNQKKCFEVYIENKGVYNPDTKRVENRK